MTVAVMQPYLFPYIGYWQLIHSVDTFVLYDDVNYIKKGYINRNSILVNHEAHTLTLELKNMSQNRPINQIEIGNNKLKLLKTIEMAYKKAMYFDTVFPLIEKTLKFEERNLAKFIAHSLEIISYYLDIKTQFVFSSNMHKSNELKAQKKIINICKSLEASKYINSIGGKSLYDKNDFLSNGIELKFLKPQIQTYKQFNHEFIGNMSIIDVLMFNTQEQVIQMLDEYELI
jgi:hypothetical protein